MKKWAIPVVIIALLSLFLFREYQITQILLPKIFVENELVLFRTPSQHIFGMGRIDSPRAKAIVRRILPFFSQTEIRDIWTIPEGKALTGSDFVIQRVSMNLVRLQCHGQVLWWIGNGFSEKEQKIAVTTGVSFASDWWMMTKNRLPTFLSLPSQGILYAGDRAPSKKTITFAQNKKLPFISTKETGGFILFFVKEEWKLKVRKKDN